MITAYNYLEILRNKWSEVPGGDVDRYDTQDLHLLSDEMLMEKWKSAYKKATTGKYFNVRGWYHTLYKDILKGKRVLDIGCGFGIDGIFFAKNGANVTFVDIVQSNLNVVSRICEYQKIYSSRYAFLNDIDDINRIKEISPQYDFIWCQGSLINAPSEILVKERTLLLELLPIGGRWIELAYPKNRWLREGMMPFDKWGSKTDGGAPWIEWYDLEKLTKVLSPAQFDVVLNIEFFNSDFVWFDLLRVA